MKRLDVLVYLVAMFLLRYACSFEVLSRDEGDKGQGEEEPTKEPHGGRSAIWEREDVRAAEIYTAKVIWLREERSTWRYALWLMMHHMIDRLAGRTPDTTHERDIQRWRIPRKNAS